MSTKVIQENKRINNVIFTRKSRLIFKRIDDLKATLIDAKTNKPKYFLTFLSRDKEAKKEEYTFEFRKDNWKVILEEKRATFEKYE